MIKQDADNTLKNSLTMLAEEAAIEQTKIQETTVLETPKIKKTKQVCNYSPSPVKRLKMSSPYKSHSFSSLQKVNSSPSQLSAKKLLRKYNSNIVRMGGQRREISSLRKSLPHMTRASSDLDLVLEAITYIQQLQNKLVTMTKNNDNNLNNTKNNFNERLV